METVHATHHSTSGSRATKITGTVVKIISILFLLFDATMKIIRERHSVSGTIELGWPDKFVQLLGILLLICTLIYAYPKAAVLGAVLLTGYLGGAIATMVRVDKPLYFSLVFGILIWIPLLLKNEQLRSLIPFIKTNY